MNLEKMKDAAKAAIEAAKEENPNKPAEVTIPRSLLGLYLSLSHWQLSLEILRK